MATSDPRLAFDFAVTEGEDLIEDISESDITKWKGEGSFLGDGAEGICYKVKHKNEDAVLKVCKKKNSSAMKREAMLMNFLQGAGGTPKLLGKKSGKNPALLMSYCGNKTLRDVLVLGSLNPGQILALIIDVGRKLLELQNLTIVHNDLKFNNIVVSDNKNPDTGLPASVHIIDFGLACENGHNWKMKADRKQFRWMAPEVLDGKASTLKSDVYSYGVMIRRGLPYHFRFQYLTNESVIRRATHNDPELRPDLEKVLEKLKKILIDYEQEQV